MIFKIIIRYSVSKKIKRKKNLFYLPQSKKCRELGSKEKPSLISIATFYPQPWDMREKQL